MKSMGFIRYWRSTLPKCSGKASLCEYHPQAMSKALMFTISINGISKLNICADSACTVSHLMGFIRYWRSTLAKAVAKGKASLCEYHLEHMSKTVVFKALNVQDSGLQGTEMGWL